MMTGATSFIGSADSLTFKLGSNPKRVTHVRVTRSLESDRAAHQANLQGVNFGSRSPDSGGQNCTPNDRHERA
jgi:hypothetical protein